MQDWLNNINVKYYESKINLNWKPIVKNIMDVRPCCTFHALNTCSAQLQSVRRLCWPCRLQQGHLAWLCKQIIIYRWNSKQRC